MATLKLSTSKKSLMLMDDRGYMFSLPVASVMALCSGRIPRGFLTMSMVPFRVDSSRFPPSPVFVDGQLYTLGEAIDKNLLDVSFYDSEIKMKDDVFAKISNTIKKPGDGKKVMDVKL